MTRLVTDDGRAYEVPEELLDRLEPYRLNQVTLQDGGGEGHDVEGQSLASGMGLNDVLRTHARRILQSSGYRVDVSAAILGTTEAQLEALLIEEPK